MSYLNSPDKLSCKKPPEDSQSDGGDCHQPLYPSTKSPDVLVLEDDPIYQEIVTEDIPTELIWELVKTGTEFREALQRCFHTTIFVVDDNVPETLDAPPDYFFIKNAEAVLEIHPNARIFCTGTSLNDKTSAFCAEHGIAKVRKEEVGTVLSWLTQSQSGNH